MMIIFPRADPQLFDERKQTELVRFSEWRRPRILRLHPVVRAIVLDREGVMEMGNGSNIPRIACHGTRDKGLFVVNEAGDNHFYELLWKLGDWARTRGRSL